MAKTETDVAQDLKSRFLGHIKTVETEYAWQVDKWRPYLVKVAEAQEAAFHNHQKVLTAALKRAQAGAELVLLALSMAGGVAIGWFGTMIRARLVNRFAKSPVFQDAFVPGAGYEIVKVSAGNLDDTTARAAFFGDKLEKVLGHGLDKVVSAVTPKSDLPALPRAALEPLRRSVQVGDYASLKTRLTSVLDEEIRIVRGQLGLFHASTNNDMNFGQKLLAQAREAHKNERVPTPLERLEVEAAGQIDDYFDKLRKKYAEDWFYFKHDPDLTNIKFLDQLIEKEVWALWLLDQEFQVTHKPETLIGPADEVRGKDRIPINLPIVQHLVQDLYVTRQELLDLEYKLQPGFWDGGFIGESLFPNEVRTADELKVLTDWAKSHPGKFAPVSYRARSLGTIKDPVTIFGGKVPTL